MKKKTKHIDFWFSIGSTYTYLTISRLRKIIKQNKINIIYKPFNVRIIMLEMNNKPFSPSKRSKVKYMWRDIQRRAEVHGIPVPLSSAPFPISNIELANQIALVGNDEGWILKYLEQTYHHWIINGFLPGEERNLFYTFNNLKLNQGKVLKTALSLSIKKNLIKQTDIAKNKGIFGSPTFLVGKEIFWGDDRFEDAIRWYNRNL